MACTSSIFLVFGDGIVDRPLGEWRRMVVSHVAADRYYRACTITGVMGFG
jgi:hypothetical protein